MIASKIKKTAQMSLTIAFPILMLLGAVSTMAGQSSEDNFSSEWIPYFDLFAGADPVKADTLFTLRRENYKSSKILHFDLRYSPASCELLIDQPLDVYYLVRTKKGSDNHESMSSLSKKYFEPKIFKDTLHKGGLEFTFAALGSKQLRVSTDGRFRVELIRSGENCEVRAEIEVEGKFRKIKHIEISLKKVFVPVDLSWIRIDFKDQVKGKDSVCAFGSECK